MAVPTTMLRTTLFASVLVACGAAHAVEPPSYFGYTSADNFNPYDRHQDVDTATTAAPATHSVNVDGNIATSITSAAGGGSAFASSRSAGAYSTEGGFTYGGGAGADAEVAYHVLLSGPSDGPFVVPVHVIAHGAVSGAGSTQASVSFVVNFDAGGSSGQMLAGTTLGSPTGNDFTFDQVAAFKVNAIFDVYLSASSGSGGPGSPAGGSQAFVDPIFTIDDPLYASLYHFEGVPAVTTSVPEPAGAALALLGIGVVFAARRRHWRA